jgi:protein involved in ribonucleotide reduction
MIDIFYFSRSGNTKKFVSHITNKAFNILDSVFSIQKGYILFTPTYSGRGEGFIPSEVSQFLKVNNNSFFLRGVIGSGNRTFLNTFNRAASLISQRYKVPLLYSYELAGNEKDVYEVKGLLQQWKN